MSSKTRKTSSAVQPTFDDLLAEAKLHEVMEATKEHSVLLADAPRGTECLCCGKPCEEGIRLPRIARRSSERQSKGGWVHEACFMDFARVGTSFPEPEGRTMTDGFVYKERLFTPQLCWDDKNDVAAHVELSLLNFKLFHDPNTKGGRMYCRTEISQKSLNRGEKELDKFLVPTKGLTTCYPELPKWRATWPTEGELKRACPELWRSLDAFGITHLKFGEVGGREGFQLKFLELYGSKEFHIGNMVVKEVAKAFMKARLGETYYSPQWAVAHWLNELKR